MHDCSTVRTRGRRRWHRVDSFARAARACCRNCRADRCRRTHPEWTGRSLFLGRHGWGCRGGAHVNNMYNNALLSVVLCVNMNIMWEFKLGGGNLFCNSWMHMSLCCNCNLLRESFPGATYDSNMCIVAPYSYVSGRFANAIKMFGDT